jgi:hypothetical protein
MVKSMLFHCSLMICLSFFQRLRWVAVRLWPIGGCGDPHEKSQVDNWWFCFPPKCLTSAKHGGTSPTPCRQQGYLLLWHKIPLSGAEYYLFLRTSPWNYLGENCGDPPRK